MHLYPSDIFQKLEFDKILDRLSTYCLGAPAKQVILRMKTFDHKQKIERLLDEIVEYQKSIDLQKVFPIYHYESV